MEKINFLHIVDVIRIIFTHTNQAAQTDNFFGTNLRLYEIIKK